jgi:hypothetical protein
MVNLVGCESEFAFPWGFKLQFIFCGLSGTAKTRLLLKPAVAPSLWDSRHEAYSFPSAEALG